MTQKLLVNKSSRTVLSHIRTSFFPSKLFYIVFIVFAQLLIAFFSLLKCSACFNVPWMFTLRNLIVKHYICSLGNQ